MTAALPDIPVIETDRLTLRAPRLEDWPANHDLLASPRAMTLGGPFEEMDAWGWFTSDLAHWSLMGHGALWADRQDTGETVGQANILNPPAWPQEELGFMVLEGCEGQGFATEAAQALRAWYYAEHPAPVQLVSFVHPDNAASASILTRLGASLDASRAAPFEGYGVYVHPAPEALQ